MWILSVIPEWIIHLTLGLGILGLIAGVLLGFIPIIGKYKLPIQIISFLVFTFSTYLEGGLADYKEWELRVKEMEKKVAEAETKSEKVNTKIVKKIITKNHVITEKGNDIIQYVDREVIKYDHTCPVPKEVVNAINSAAQNKPVDEKK